LPRRFPFLLESAAGGPLDRYSLLLRSAGERLTLTADHSLEYTGAGSLPGNGFLDALDAWYQRERRPDDGEVLPFLGGWFLYLGYELAGEIEPRLDLPAAGDGLPIALADRCDGAVIIEHGDSPRGWLVAENKAVMAAMEDELFHIDRDSTTQLTVLDELSAEPAADFETAVRRIQEYLLAGDVFQVNLSRGWRGRFEPRVDPLRLYRSLRTANWPCSAHRRNVWWKSGAGRCKPARSPEPTRAAALPNRTPPSPKRCWLIPRSRRNTSCSSTLSAMTWAACARPAALRWTS
jgi:anthranilate synthase component 1